jgi:serine/threonine-protein kinase
VDQEHEQLRRAQERIGHVLRDRWRLDALLGIGGMAAVYAATHRNGKRVALKMLHPELSTVPQLRQRFIDEGYVANRLDHPGAISVLDDEVAEDGAVYLVMDLLQGETLEQRQRRVITLHAVDVLKIADELLDVLAVAHEKGIVHRDVKPDNVFLTEDGAVRLLDFGIARVSDPGRPHTTLLGETMGTPAFMPPEQARGRWDEIDGRTDLWAVGATMFFALCGRPVHRGETANEQLLAAMTEQASSLNDMVPGLPSRLVDVVDRALAFEKTDRWPDARAMQAKVRELLASIEPSRELWRGDSKTLRAVETTAALRYATRAAWITFDPWLRANASRRKVLWGAAGSIAFLVLAIWLAAPRSGTTVPHAQAIGPVLAPEPPAPSASAWPDESKMFGATCSSDPVCSSIFTNDSDEPVEPVAVDAGPKKAPVTSPPPTREAARTAPSIATARPKEVRLAVDPLARRK